MNMFLTDKFGMSFYTLKEPRFTTNLDTHKTVNRHNPISGHRWTERIPKNNAGSIAAKIDRQYAKWLTFREVTNKLHMLNFWPRTPKETLKIQEEYYD